MFEAAFDINLNPFAPNDMEGSNFSSTPLTLYAAPPADLVVTDVVAPATAHGGEAVTIPDAEILAAIPEIAQATGIFAEPAAAAPLAALKRLSQREIVDPDDLVVCLVTGNGLKDVAAAAGVSGKALNIDPTIEAVRASV